MASQQDFITLLERVRALEAQLGTLIQRGEVVSTSEEAGRNPALDVLSYAGSPDTKLERLQDYGFASRPLPGSEAAVLWVNGKRDVALVISVADRRYRLVLEEGDAALYDHRGQKVHLHDNGMDVKVIGNLEAEVTKAAIIDCPQTHLTGNLYVGGDLVVKGIGSGDGGPMQISGGITNTGGDIVSDSIVFDTHTHDEVQSGPDDTGGPK